MDESQPDQKPSVTQINKDDLRKMYSILEKYNLQDTENVLKQELKLSESQILELKKESFMCFSLADQYSRLQDFIKQSMSLHRAELKVLLYPSFVSIYIHLIIENQLYQAKDFYDIFEKYQEEMYRSDLTSIKNSHQSGLDSKNSTLEVFNSNDFNVRICRASNNYLKKSFLDEKAVAELAQIIASKIKIEIYEGLPRKESDINMRRGALIGESSADKNDKPVLYGNLNDPQLDGFIKRRLDSQNDFNDDAAKKRKLKKESPSKLPGYSRNCSGKSDAPCPEFNRVPLPTLSSQDREYIRAMYTEIASLPRLRRKRRLFTEDLGRNDSVLPVMDGIVDKQRYLRDGIPLNSVMYTMGNMTAPGACAAEFNEDCSMLAVGQAGGLLHVRALTSDSLSILKSSDDLNQLFAADANANSRMMYNSTGSQYIDLKGHSAGVYGLAWSTDKSLIVSASSDSTVRLWSTQTWSALARYQDGNDPLWAVDIAPIYGHYLVTGGHDRAVTLFATDSLRPLRKFLAPDCYAPVTCVRFHPNINYVASGSADRVVRLFDVRTGAAVRAFTGHKGTVNSVQFSECGRFLLSGCDSGSVNIWDLSVGSSNSLVDNLHLTGGRDLTGGPVNSLTLCRDGAVLAVGRQAGQVDVWNLSKLLKTATSAAATTTSAGTDVAGGEEPTSQQQSMDMLDEGSDLAMIGRRRHPLEGIIDILYTKKTPLLGMRFNRRNMLCCCGVFNQI